MLKSFLAAIAIFLASIFGPHSVDYSARAPATGAHPSAAQSEQISQSASVIVSLGASGAATSTPPHLPDSSGEQIQNPRPLLAAAIDHVPPQQYLAVSDPAVTELELTQKLQALDNKFQSEISSWSPVFSGASAPISVASFAPSQQIGQLFGTKLTNITVSGVSGLTAADIPALSYLSLSGGAVSGATSFTGNVGIGTTSPMAALSIVGGDITHVASGNPTLLSSTSGGGGRGVKVVGKYAYIATGGGLRIYDVSNPASPALMSNYTTNYGYDVFVSGKYVYLSDDNDGLKIIDVSNPSAPVLAGSIGSGNGCCNFGAYVSGKYAYIADYGYSAGLQIVDISNPSSPKNVGSMNISAGGGVASVGIYVSGKYAYLTLQSGGLDIIDISNPASPLLVSNVSLGGGTAYEVYVSGRYAYVAAGSVGLKVVDVSNPASPTVLGSLTTSGGGARYVYVAGKYAYVTDQNSGALTVIDVSNPASPLLVGQDSSSSGQAVYVSGKYAYVDGSTLRVYDINGIETPALNAGDIETSVLNATDNVNVGGNIYSNGMNAGIGGIFSLGPIGAFVSSTTAANPIAATFMGGNVAIGTLTPYSRLTVFGPDTSGSTAALTIANSASTTELQVFDNGSATLAGTLTQNSDARLKTNVQTFDATDTLALIDQLNPITFNWLDPSEGATTQIGFIAQDVQKLFPDLVSTTSPTALTPGGTLGLNYIGLISPIVSAVQALDNEITALANTVANFAESFTSREITATNELCVGSTCVTEAQFQAMVAAAGQSSSAPSLSPADAAASSPSLASSNPTASTTAATDATSTSNSTSDATSSLPAVEAPPLVPDYNASTTLPTLQSVASSTVQ